MKAEKHVEQGITVFDQHFYRYANECGQQYVENFITESVKRMGQEIVAAYEAHDDKDYEATSEHFANVFYRQFDVDEETSQQMGYHRAKALKEHDKIEDGEELTVEQVRVQGKHPETPDRSVPEILADDRWTTVYDHLDQFESPLDLDGSFADEYTKFLQYHTAGREAEDNEEMKEACLILTKRYAKRSEFVLSSPYFDDPKILNNRGELFWEMVRTHDTDKESHRKESPNRMAFEYYEDILESVVQERAPSLLP